MEKVEVQFAYLFEKVFLDSPLRINFFITTSVFVFILHFIFFTENAVSERVKSSGNPSKTPGDTGDDDIWKEWIKYILKIILIVGFTGFALYFTYSLFFAYNMFYVENTLSLFLHDAEIPGIEGKGYFQILNEVIPQINAFLGDPNNGLSSQQIALLEKYKEYCQEFSQTVGTTNSFDMSKLMKCVFFVEEEKASGSLVKLYKAFNVTSR